MGVAAVTPPEVHARFMRRALDLARQAAALDEVPVGAVVVVDAAIVAEGHNACIGTNDPSAHAELLALRRAGQRLGNYRLTRATVYTTLEPCAMCAGAMLNARIEQLVFAARDAKAGAAGSLLNLLETDWLAHRCKVTAGVLEQPSRALLQTFFQARRGK